ncbi:hypothetical protein [Paenibacillus taiwanensis]|uniref:hypothetical protein n=1 Tax=Paenibacillus taiwanensis TaxID=401638 RepID=UPI00048BC433|nr:hypothetical protein [Paenibacillus taiwanensis]
MLYSIVAVVIVIALTVYVVLRRFKSRKANHNIVSMNRYKAMQQGSQKCSYCKQKSNKLIFYADHNGSVVGACRQCQPIAERKDMLPI